MARIQVDARYQELGLAWIAALGSSGVNLSEHSKMLLLLTVEGWFEDRPPFLRDVSDVQMGEVLGAIVHQSMDEEHVVKRKLEGEEVPIAEWLYAMAKTGREIVRSVFTKGF